MNQSKSVGWQWVLSLCLITLVLAACGRPDVKASGPDTPATSGTGETSGTGDTSAGAELFEELGCIACHQMNGKGPGPSLAGLYGSTITLQNGETVTADEQYIRRSILEPQAQVHAGYMPIMPAFGGRVDDNDLAALLTYIRSLEE